MRTILTLGAWVVWNHLLLAQCPDGSQPPCARTAPRAPAANSVAVLYFDNLSRDTADAYLADGLTEEIIVRLGQIHRLDVKSRYEVQGFRGRPGGDPALLGRALNAANIVSGSVQKAGGRVRVRVELVRAASRSRLWGDVFDRASDDILAIEEEIASAVVQGVAGQLLPDERTTLARRPTRSAAAYDLYLRGRAALRRLHEASLRGAIVLFDQALAFDSGFASAQSGIAGAWTNLADDWVPPREAYPLARAAAQRALHADSGDAEAWASLAAVAIWFDWAPARAESLARRAIALDAHSAAGHLIRGEALAALDSASEAADEYERAFNLDSMSEEIMAEAAYGLVSVNRYDQAVAMARRFQRAVPASLDGYRSEALADFLREDCGSALPVLQHMRAIGDSEPYYAVAELHCRGNDGAARQLIAARVHAWEQSRAYFRAGLVARMYVLLGDRDEGFTWLERAFDAREATLANLAYSPRWHLLRDDPRFADLVRRVRPHSEGAP